MNIQPTVPNIIQFTARLLDVLAKSTYHNKFKVYKLMKENKPKRDAKGRFVKTKPSYEELEAKIALLAAELDDREQSLVKVDNELKFWKQEFGELKRTNERLQESVTNLEVIKYWFLKHCGLFLRKKYYRAVENGELDTYEVRN